MPLLNKIKKALKKIAVYFYYSRKTKFFDFINPLFYLRRNYEKKSRQFIKNKSDLHELIQKMLKASNSTGCEYGDYYSLYKTIKKIKPKKILECGSGISSCVIAFTLREIENETGQKAIYYSLEENEFYYNQVIKIFPDELRDYVSFLLLERKEKRYLDYLGSYYDQIPDITFDFIFIDGPTDRKVWNNFTHEKCFNSDIINLILRNKNAKINGLLDQRIHTYWTLKKLMPKATIKYNPVNCLSTISGASYNSLDRDLFEEFKKEERS